MDTRTQSRTGRHATTLIHVGRLAMLCSLPLLALACDGPSPVASGPALDPGAVSVSPAAIRMAVGDEQEFSAILSEALELQGAGKVFWSISDGEVATLTVIRDRLAVVTARSPGWATITATSGVTTGKATIQVEGRVCGNNCRDLRPWRPLGGSAR